MDIDIDYLEDDILEDFGELKELDFGNRKGKSSESQNEEDVQKKIEYVDENLDLEHLKTTSIGPEDEKMLSSMCYSARLTEEDRDEQIKNAIVDLLGNPKLATEAVEE